MNQSPPPTSQQASRRQASDLGLIGLGVIMLMLPIPLLLEGNDINPAKVMVLGALVIPPALALLYIQRRKGRSGLGISVAQAERRR